MSSSRPSRPSAPKQPAPDPLLGLAVILRDLDEEKSPVRRVGFRYVLEGALEKLGIAESAVRSYLETHTEEVERARRARTRS